MSYDLEPIRSPRASGLALRALVALVESPLTGWALAGKMLRDAGVERLREIDPGTEPLPFSHPVRGLRAADPQSGPEPTDEEVAGDPGRFSFETVSDFLDAYRTGRLDVREVAARFAAARAATEAVDPPLRSLLRSDADDIARQAEESAELWRKGQPRSALEGVPVAVKDEVDQVPYPTTVGTRFLGREPVERDAEAVRRLRAAGALLVGKANMHEIGLGVTGLNPHHGPARNPWDLGRATGGSSSGSAAAVAAGLCPLALGADGGGSVRIPATFCGLVGLKPTFGRISERGVAPVCWSVAHLGPLAGSARDAALAYRVMAGEDPGDATTLGQPEPRLVGLLKGDLTGLRIGFYPEWFADADPEVVARSRELLDRFVDRGAQLVEVEIPELAMMRAVHLVTIVGEMAAAQSRHLDIHRAEYGLDIRLALALARRLRADDYVQAQRHRLRLCRTFTAVLEQVDLIATPATGTTAPRLPGGAALRTGLSDLVLTERILRFCQAANVTGLPAISIPAGLSSEGLPIGLQLMGRAWDEALLLRMAVVAEELVERRRPPLYHSLVNLPRS